MEPFVVGICGKTCSGKTTICKTLVEKYPDKVLHIKLDRYFKKEAKNQEVPQSLCFNYFIETIRLLKAGKPAMYPDRNRELKEVCPKEILIVDGFLIFADEELLELLDLKLYVDIPEEVMLRRRLARDNMFPREYIINTVLPESRNFIWQKEKADFVIDGADDPGKVFSEVDRILQKQITHLA